MSGMEEANRVRMVSLGQGLDWIKRGFALFMRTPWVWIGITLLLFLIQSAAALVPLGQFVVFLLGPVFGAGILFACRDLEAGRAISVGHLFNGFRSERAGTLVLLGLLVLLLFVFVSLAVGILSLALFGDAEMHIETLAEQSAIGVLVIAPLLLVPTLMAVWFTTQLVALHEMEPVPAMRASFAGCLRNLGPLTIYGLILIPLAVLASIPFGLGMLVLAPVVLAANYYSYLDIYGEPASGQQTTQTTL